MGVLSCPLPLSDWRPIPLESQDIADFAVKYMVDFVAASQVSGGTTPNFLRQNSTQTQRR